MNATFSAVVVAILLALGLCGCGATAAEETDAQPMPSDASAAIAADEEVALSLAFDALVPGDDGTLCERIGEADEALVGCGLRVDSPHKSTHVPGTVNVVATVECNRAVASIRMLVGLARDGQEIASATFNNLGNRSLRGNAAAPCGSGTYQGAAAAEVTFPPGSLPASGTLHANSSRIFIDCQ